MESEKKCDENGRASMKPRVRNRDRTNRQTANRAAGREGWRIGNCKMEIIRLKLYPNHIVSLRERNISIWNIFIKFISIRLKCQKLEMVSKRLFGDEPLREKNFSPGKHLPFSRNSAGNNFHHLRWIDEWWILGQKCRRLSGRVDLPESISFASVNGRVVNFVCKTLKSESNWMTNNKPQNKK